MIECRVVAHPGNIYSVKLYYPGASFEIMCKNCEAAFALKHALDCHAAEGC